MAVGVAMWMGLTYVAALFGVLRFDSRPPTMMLLVPVMLALSVGLAVSSAGRRLATGLPLWILVGFQSFRLPLTTVPWTRSAPPSPPSPIGCGSSRIAYASVSHVCRARMSR
jgi:hypothetical protein